MPFVIGIVLTGILGFVCPAVSQAAAHNDEEISQQETASPRRRLLLPELAEEMAAHINKQQKYAAVVDSTEKKRVDAAKNQTTKNQITLKTTNVKVEATKHHSEEQLRTLVPELEKDTVNVGRLSHQIQLANDTGAVKIDTDFRRQSGDTYEVTLHAEDKKAESWAVNVNNTGNDYTGNWRVGVTYMNRNFTGVDDTLGAAYVTSPGHFDEVKQAALFYRVNLPRAGDSLYAAYSWSDVDLGTIGNFSGLGIEATGRGATVGVHYQHNFKYTKAHRQILDVGFDHKHYRNATSYSYSSRDINNSTDYDVAAVSVSYADIRRSAGQYAAWSVGYTGNLNKDDGFLMNRPGSDSHFHLWKASANYQRRLPNDMILGLRLSGQYSAQKTVTTEQFGAGGASSVRGFKERAAYADKGISGSLELYSPELWGAARFVAFVDYAKLRNNNPAPNEMSSGSLGSYGLGIRYNDKKSGLYAAVDYAHAFSNRANTVDNLRPWHITVGYNF